VWVEVTAGFRLPCPDNCPSSIYLMMKECWQQDPTSRPSFLILYETLQKVSGGSRRENLILNATSEAHDQHGTQHVYLDLYKQLQNEDSTLHPEMNPYLEPTPLEKEKQSTQPAVYDDRPKRAANKSALNSPAENSNDFQFADKSDQPLMGHANPPERDTSYLDIVTGFGFNSDIKE
jgi:hypothetical protein